MNLVNYALRSLAIALAFAAFTTPMQAAEDPLPSWNDGKTKTAIVDFVETVSTEGGEGFVPPEERVAVFDNDGTLWCEQPMYVQLAFALDRVKALAPQHPEWKTEEPFASVLKGDMKGVMSGGKKALAEIIAATHAGMTTDEFETIASDWIATAKHPERGVRYVDMTYQPMLELLAYLRANGFRTFIVSGGGVDFMRPWTKQAYGIPPEQVIGTTVELEWEMTDDGPRLNRMPAIDFVDDKEGKPVNIHRRLGVRPIAAFGNSDGDLAMLQWTAAGEGERFCLIVHHTDADREYAYDRQSSIGKLDKALDEASDRGWTVVDMKRDWNAVFAEKSATE